MRGWSDIAVLAKTRNLDGGFVVKSAASLPFLLSVGNEVAFVPPVIDMPRRAVVEEVSLIDDNSALVYFDCIDNKNDAALLVGCHCLVQLSEDQRAAAANAPQSWAGWIVIDKKFDRLGEVLDIFENPGQTLLEVERDDEARSLLIPVVDEFVLDVDPDNRIIRTDIPAGLLDL